MKCAVISEFIRELNYTIVKPLKRRLSIASGLFVLSKTANPTESGQAIKTEREQVGERLGYVSTY